MKNKRGNKKIINLALNNIRANKKEYFIATAILFVGFVIGIILINNSDSQNQQEVVGYITNFIDTIKNNEYKIDSNALIKKTVWLNTKIAGIIWIAGSTILGLPIVYAAVCYKGLCIGYSAAAIIATLGKAKGSMVLVASMLLHNIIVIPCILGISVSSIRLYKSIRKERDIRVFKNEMYRHTMFSVLMWIGLIISSIIEVFVSTYITSNIIVKFL